MPIIVSARKLYLFPPGFEASKIITKTHLKRNSYTSAESDLNYIKFYCVRCGRAHDTGICKTPVNSRGIYALCGRNHQTNQKSYT